MNKLQTHADFNKAYMKSIKAYRTSRDFETARRILSYFRMIRKLQKQCGVR